MKRFFEALQRTMKGTALYCPYCRSWHISHSTPEQRHEDSRHTDRYAVTCLDCGAHGTIMERWEAKEEN